MYAITINPLNTILPMNIPKYIDGFSKEMIRRNYRQNTVDNYVSNLKVFLSKHNHLEHPLHINEGHIRAYLGAYKEPNTQRSHHGAIKLFYDICMNQKGKFILQMSIRRWNIAMEHNVWCYEK